MRLARHAKLYFYHSLGQLLKPPVPQFTHCETGMTTTPSPSQGSSRIKQVNTCKNLKQYLTYSKRFVSVSFKEKNWKLDDNLRLHGSQSLM